MGGKYSSIVFAIALFLIFDLGVLVLNFYTSYQIADDASAINMAGRQRMLSQRITKSLLSVEVDTRADLATGKTLDELKVAAGLFGDTLGAFKNGGSVMGGSDKPVTIKKIATPEGASILAEAQALWEPLRTSIQLIVQGQTDTAILAQTVAYARTNNVKLLTLMNGLTTHLENLAKDKTDKLRMIQTIGIGLALFNFALVLFHFIRKLKAGDLAIEAAQKENREILDTVGEGLFLLGPDMKLGTQFSTALSAIFGQPIQAGMDFMGMLKNMVTPEVAANTATYLELLFGGRVKENLVGDLNPLAQAEAMVLSPSGQTISKFLAMQFNRVYVEGKISHLLTTVRDVTEKVILEKQLATTKERTQTELRMLLAVLSVQPAELVQFTENVRTACNDINDWLKQAKASPTTYRSIVDDIFRCIHSIKGEASALELESFVNLIHDFEDCLTPLKANALLAGEDLLPIALQLQMLHEQMLVLDTVAKKLTGYAKSAPASTETASSAWAAKLSRLTSRIADDLGKPVQVYCNTNDWEKLSTQHQQNVNDIVVQLVRNAVAHGIEPLETRLEKAKPVQGHIQVALESVATDEFRLVVRDDGQGLVPERIRTALAHAGRYSDAQLRAMSDRDVVMKLFEPGISTTAQAGVHSGRGVGLDLVHELLRKLNGKLSIKSRSDQFTAFTISFSAASA
jgi:signal transduction histidine kinase